MKHISTIISATLVVVALSAAAQAFSSRSTEVDEVQALKTQVTELQTRLAILERKVEAINLPRMYKATP